MRRMHYCISRLHAYAHGHAVLLDCLAFLSSLLSLFHSFSRATRNESLDQLRQRLGTIQRRLPWDVRVVQALP